MRLSQRLRLRLRLCLRLRLRLWLSEQSSHVLFVRPPESHRRWHPKIWACNDLGGAPEVFDSAPAGSALLRSRSRKCA
jgi:hypothetical protein